MKKWAVFIVSYASQGRAGVTYLGITKESRERKKTIER